MIGDYDWDEIISEMKKFAGVETIDEIFVVGKEGIRRIKLGDVILCDNCNENEVEHEGDWCDDCNEPERSWVK
jgi:hypothetical protein